MSATKMSPKLVESTMDIKNSDGAKIDKFDNLGRNGDELENMVVLDS
jgi:hypothetical protein